MMLHIRAIARQRQNTYDFVQCRPDGFYDRAFKQLGF